MYVVTFRYEGCSNEYELVGAPNKKEAAASTQAAFPKAKIIRVEQARRLPQGR